MASVVVAGSATNPQATNLITGASVALGQGIATVTVTTMLTGTIAAGDLNNMQLQVGSTVIGTLFTVNPAAASGAYLNVPVIVNIPVGGASVTVNAIANASGASAVYKCQMVVTTP